MDDKTRIPITFVAICIPFLIGGIMWLASVDAKASVANELKPMVYDILQRVIRIEEHQRDIKR